MRRGVGGKPDPIEYEEKKEKLSELKQLEDEGEIDLYYLDESGFCGIPCVPYGWQDIGEYLSIDNRASIHTSNAIFDKLEEWKERGLTIFELPTYSPELNLIEILWRFIKYTWLEIDAYSSWQSLVSSVEKILKEFGDNYVINFA